MSDIEGISAARQLAFHQLLVAARKTWLIDALSDAVLKTEPKLLKKQLSELVPDDAQRIIAAAGIRDEQVFPVPALLETSPTLVGYYRLLLGIPQKTFYSSATRMSRFKSMEIKGTLSASQKASLPDFCKAMIAPLSDLIRQISPPISVRDVQELPLLILGSQFQGGNNNLIGQRATIDVFLAIAEIVGGFAVDRTQQKIVIQNSAGRRVTIALSSDPDVSITEEIGQNRRKVIAIEIKGGTDRSNAHNRAGEAEKSHQKARQEGFLEFWTVIAKRGLDMSRLESESPTTNSWYDVSQVLAREGDDWKAFMEGLVTRIGIPVKPRKSVS